MEYGLTEDNEKIILRRKDGLKMVSTKSRELLEDYLLALLKSDSQFRLIKRRKYMDTSRKAQSIKRPSKWQLLRWRIEGIVERHPFLFTGLIYFLMIALIPFFAGN